MESPSSNKNLIYPCMSLWFVLFLDLFKNFFACFKVTQCSSTFSSRNYIVLSFHIWIENLFRISFYMEYDIDIKSCFFFFFLYERPNLLALFMRRPPFLPALLWHLSHDSRVRISVDVFPRGCWSSLSVFRIFGMIIWFPLYSVNVGKYTVWFLNVHLGWAPLGGLFWLQTATVYI